MRFLGNVLITFFILTYAVSAMSITTESQFRDLVYDISYKNHLDYVKKQSTCGSWIKNKKNPFSDSIRKNIPGLLKDLFQDRGIFANKQVKEKGIFSGERDKLAFIEFDGAGYLPKEQYKPEHLNALIFANWAFIYYKYANVALDQIKDQKLKQIIKDSRDPNVRHLVYNLVLTIFNTPTYQKYKKYKGLDNIVVNDVTKYIEQLRLDTYIRMMAKAQAGAAAALKNVTTSGLVYEVVGGWRDTCRTGNLEIRRYNDAKTYKTAVVNGKQYDGIITDEFGNHYKYVDEDLILQKKSQGFKPEIPDYISDKSMVHNAAWVGNSCYRNSVLQALMASPSFCTLIHNMAQKEKGTSFSLATALDEWFTLLHEKRPDKEETNNCRAKIVKGMNDISKEKNKKQYNQKLWATDKPQSSCLFCHSLMDALGDEMKCLLKGDNSLKSFEDYFNECLMTKTIYTRRCTKCGVYDTLIMDDSSLPDKKRREEDQFILDYTSCQGYPQVSGKNQEKWDVSSIINKPKLLRAIKNHCNCEGCAESLGKSYSFNYSFPTTEEEKKYVNNWKITGKYLQLPKILIHIKNEENYGAIYEEELEITNCKYKLVGVVLNRFGHFTAKVQALRDNKWYDMNDTSSDVREGNGKVKLLSSGFDYEGSNKNEPPKNAAIFVYERIDG